MMLSNVSAALLLALSPFAMPQDAAPDSGTVEVLVTNEDDEGIFGVECRLVLTEDEIAAIRKQQDPTGKRQGYTLPDAPRTDPDGFAEVTVPAGVERKIEIGGWSRFRKKVTLTIEPMKPGEFREHVAILKTKPDVEVRGRVVSDEDGSPLEGVALHIDPEGRTPEDAINNPANFVPLVTTDATGAFVVPLRSWQSGVVGFALEGWSPAVVRLISDGIMRNDVEIRLKRTATLTGVVKADSLEGLRIDVEVPAYELDGMLDEGQFGSFIDGDWKRTLRVDPETGSFQLTGLPAGTRPTLKLARGREELMQSRTKEPLTPHENRELELVILPDRSIVGRAVEVDGSPLAEQSIWLLKKAYRGGFLQWYDRPTKEVVTDAEGNFRFDGLRPGEWRVSLARPAEDVAPQVAHAALASKVKLGNEDATVELTAHRGLFIQGRVTGPEGSPAPPSTRVTLMDGTLGNLSEQIAEDGTFRLGPLPPGTFDLVAKPLGAKGRLLAQSINHEVRPNQDPLTLELRHGAAITAAFTRAGSTEPVPCQFSWSSEYGVSMTGEARSSLEETSRVPGPFVVLASSFDGLAGIARWDLAEGDDLDVTGELDPGGTLSAKIKTSREDLIKFVYLLLEDDFEVRIGWGELDQRLPAGDYRVRVTAADRQDPETLLFEATQRCRVEAGKTTKLEFAFENEVVDGT